MPSTCRHYTHYALYLQAMFLSIVLGTSATPLTSYLLFSIAILQVAVATWQVVRYKKKGKVDCLTADLQVHTGSLGSF